MSSFLCFAFSVAGCTFVHQNSASSWGWKIHRWVAVSVGRAPGACGVQAGAEWLQSAQHVHVLVLVTGMVSLLITVLLLLYVSLRHTVQGRISKTPDRCCVVWPCLCEVVALVSPCSVGHLVGCVFEVDSMLTSQGAATRRQQGATCAKHMTRQKQCMQDSDKSTVLLFEGCL